MSSKDRPTLSPPADSRSQVVRLSESEPQEGGYIWNREEKDGSCCQILPNIWNFDPRAESLATFEQAGLVVRLTLACRPLASPYASSMRLAPERHSDAHCCSFAYHLTIQLFVTPFPIQHNSHGQDLRFTGETSRVAWENFTPTPSQNRT